MFGTNHVLLVEDDPVLNSAMSDGLGRAGYDVISIDNGTEALAKALEIHQDAICSTLYCLAWTV